MAPRTERFSPQNYSLLVISSDILTRQSLSANLEAGGFHLSSANSPHKTEEIINAEHFDLFIIDSHIEGIDSEQMLRQLKQHPKYKDTPAIMLIEKEDKLAGSRALELGASHFLRKPVNSVELAEHVTQILSARPKSSSPKNMKIARPKKTNYTILVVEDEKVNRDLLVRRLKKEGFTTIEASNGLVALEKLDKQRFDLVILDIMMPEVDGFEVLSKIKMHDESKNIPVIMLTALNDVESVRQCMQFGVDDYITKPFNYAQLRSKIQACLGIIR